MQRSQEQVKVDLERGKLAPVYLVTGDEPLGQLEVLDAIRRAARAAGAEERVVLQAGGNFAWGMLEAELSVMSLFGSRRMVEVELPSGKPGTDGSKVLQRVAEHASLDCLLIVATGRLEKEQKSSRWVQALDGAGVTVECSVPGRAQLPDWIARRAGRIGVQLSDDALAVLAERSEGNLFACAQALEMLALLHPDVVIDGPAVLAATGDSSRFNVFMLGDAALAGDIPRALRVLDGLRSEGVEPVLVSWVMRRELRLLATLASASDGGRNSLQAAFTQLRIWPQRQAAYSQTLKRVGAEGIARLYAASLALDRQVKGVQRGPDPFDTFGWLVMALGGVRLAPGVLP